MKAKLLLGLVPGTFIAALISCRSYDGMLEPHTYDWRTGLPGLEQQVTMFQQSKMRWPTNYVDLANFMNQSVTNFVPVSYDRIDFDTKPDGSLEIDVYVFASSTTNHITMKAP